MEPQAGPDRINHQNAADIVTGSEDVGDQAATWADRLIDLVDAVELVDLLGSERGNCHGQAQRSSRMSQKQCEWQLLAPRNGYTSQNIAWKKNIILHQENVIFLLLK